MKQVARNKASSSSGRGNDTSHAPQEIAERAGFYFVQPASELFEVIIADVVDSEIDSTGPVDDFIYLDIGSVDRERKAFADPKMVPFAKAPSRAKQKVKAGDVLVSMTRPNLNAVAKVTREQHGSIASTGFHVLRSSWLEAGFLYYLVQTDCFVDAMCSVVQGALYPAVRPRDIEGFKFYLPPRAEQTRIVEKLEELLSDLDAGVAELKVAQRKLAQYRQSLLKAAVEGALTADWRAARRDKAQTPNPSFPRKRESSDVQPTTKALDSRFRGNDNDGETGAKLLQRILTERRARWEAKQRAKFAEQGKTPPQGWQGKYKEPAAPDTSDLLALPLGWVWATIEQISSVVADGVHKKPMYISEGIPFVTVRNLTASLGITFDAVRYISRSDHEAFIRRTHPERGDILISKDGTLGVTRVVNTDREFSIFVSVALVKPLLTEMSDFLGIAISSPIVQKQMVPKGSGLVHIHLEDLRKDCIPIPPVAEQLAICDVLLQALVDAESQEQFLADCLKQSAAQRKNILKAAFAGQLVPQDPNDEPASVLLERIRAERAAAGAKRVGKTGRKRKEQV